MKTFLHMKHWQIFLSGFVLPLFAYMIILLISIFSGNVIYLVLSVVVLNLLMMSVLYGWQYTVVNSLNKLLPEGTQTNMNLYRWCLIAMLGIVAVMGIYMMKLFNNLNEVPEAFSPVFILLLIPVIIVSFAASIYTMLAFARSLVAVERQAVVFFSDYVVEFILLWFWIVGIWVLQPRINKIFNEDLTPPASNMPPPLPSL